MSHSELEFVTAPRLEQDVLEHYQTIRFAPIPEGTDYDAHQKNIDQEFKRKLSGYFSAWRRMMAVGIHEHLSFSFWADKFFQAYCSVLQEEQIRFFEVTAQRSAGFYIDKIVKRLRVLFESTSLTEEMHKLNECYEKRTEKLRESYRNTSQIYPDAADLKLELSLNDGGNEIIDLRQLERFLSNFQKSLAAEYWYRTQAIYRFYQIVRDDVQQRYVIHFYLSFNRSLYADPLFYCSVIERCWAQVTNYMGTCSCLSLTDQNSVVDAEQMFRIDRIIQEDVQCPLSALNSMPENQTGRHGLANRICIYPKGFKWFDGAPVRR
ncbi:MAG TPA: hypothetical protein DIT34_03845 [Acinetobacter ursingii]|jgi:hypothetical protein|uniref:Uncharacterized protein n=3 Tax=Acinetobacter TaxID=469 RepID=N8QCY6_9GAMM|nr:MULTISPECIES: hypothetical protein [Acinetobacter]APU47793.1 hypothetical protein BVL33_04325 [Acinetobacter junii]ENU11664.1 hypothetical protein F996_03079 [Acinetobacter baumannii NIPH 24]ENU36601.1 hypothetical protein F988_01234 [Acinetobacter parvus DSM 16617 = CIP 108168]ENU84392.1 hypothetical protein F974_00493 [Acinetobacter sp. CIP 102159]ENU89795.1 hypothetical protein F972_00835 [Acinetobacter sp. CIP 102529]